MSKSSPVSPSQFISQLSAQLVSAEAEVESRYRVWSESGKVEKPRSWRSLVEAQEFERASRESLEISEMVQRGESPVSYLLRRRAS